MRVDILTIFPGFFVSPLSESLLGQAIDGGVLDVRLVDLRAFSEDPHRKVDDEPYGGGPGMVMTAPPPFAALEARERGFREVLFSGHHERIRRWRRERQLVETWERRPDLLEKADLTPRDRAFLAGLAAPVAGEPSNG